MRESRPTVARPSCKKPAAPTRLCFGTGRPVPRVVFKQKGNIGLVLRQIPNKLLSMDDLACPRSAGSDLNGPRGCFS